MKHEDLVKKAGYLKDKIDAYVREPTEKYPRFSIMKISEKIDGALKIFE